MSDRFRFRCLNITLSWISHERKRFDNRTSFDFLTQTIFLTHLCQRSGNYTSFDFLWIYTSWRKRYQYSSLPNMEKYFRSFSRDGSISAYPGEAFAKKDGMICVPRKTSDRGDRSNFGGRVLGCIEAKFCKKIIFKTCV